MNTHDRRPHGSPIDTASSATCGAVGMGVVEAVGAARVQALDDQQLIITRARFTTAALALSLRSVSSRAPRQLTSLSLLRTRAGESTAQLARWAYRPTHLGIDEPSLPPVEWTEVAPAIHAALDGLPIVVHNGWAEYLALRHHLPDWAVPAEVLALRTLARPHGKHVAARSLVAAWQSTRPTCRLTCGPELAWCQLDHTVLIHELLHHVTTSRTTWADIRTAAALPVRAMTPHTPS